VVIEDDKEPILTREEFNPMTASNEKTLEIRSKSRETQKNSYGERQICVPASPDSQEKRSEKGFGIFPNRFFSQKPDRNHHKTFAQTG